MQSNWERDPYVQFFYCGGRRRSKSMGRRWETIVWHEGQTFWESMCNIDVVKENVRRLVETRWTI